ncbi:hypothetical protein ACT8ZV_07895 [Nocardioides sp. MAHUQ-72]|uniref:hypothetical protein n=1 Tax=unclassified Nocardioides TaxID=2615069 RepID=UPI0036167CC5
MFKSRFMPCPECGASVDLSRSGEHACSPEQRAEFQMQLLRDEVAHLETGFQRFLTTAEGQFESWLAARRVRTAS